MLLRGFRSVRQEKAFTTTHNLSTCPLVALSLHSRSMCLTTIANATSPGNSAKVDINYSTTKARGMCSWRSQRRHSRASTTEAAGTFRAGSTEIRFRSLTTRPALTLITKSRRVVSLPSIRTMQPRRCVGVIRGLTRGRTRRGPASARRPSRLV